MTNFLEFSLFVSSFLAATIFPFSSEAALYLAIDEGLSKERALFFASCGNLLAIVVNYFLGRFIYESSKKKLKRSKLGKKALFFGFRYRYPSLLFSWLPIIGDPLTIVAGILKIDFFYFLLIAGSLRVARYYFLTLVI